MITTRLRPVSRGFPLANPAAARLLRALESAAPWPSGSASAIHAFVRQAQQEGWWAKLHAFYGFVGGNATAHGINWVTPGTYDITNADWTSGVTHDANGIQPDGTTGYGDTGLEPLTVGATGGLGVCILQPATTANHVHIGADTSGHRFVLYGRETSSGTLGMWGEGDFATEAAVASDYPTPVGLWYVQRSANDRLALFAHGALQNENTNSLNPDPVGSDIFIGARNNAGSPTLYSDARYGAAWISDGTLTDAEVLRMTKTIQRLQVRLARTVTLHDGIWNQWIQPLAVRQQGAHDRFYIGAIASDRSVVAASYDRDTGELSTFDLGDSPSTDDHNAPAILPGVEVANDPLTVFWNGHADAALEVRWRRASAAESVAAFDTLQTIAVPQSPTYVQAYRCGAKIVLFVRRQAEDGSSPNAWMALVSEDNGANWRVHDAFSSDLTTSGRTSLYVQTKLSSHGRILHAAFHDHPISGTNQDIVVLSIDLQNGGIYQPASGERVGNLFDAATVSPFAVGFPMVYAQPNERTRLYDISRDGRMIAYARFTDTTDARYEVAVLDDFGIIRTQDLGAAGLPLEEPAGANYYFAGMNFGEQPGVVYLAREISGAHRVERWETRDHGMTWDSTILSEADSSEKRFRPVPVQQGGAGEPLLWCEGIYIKFDKDAGENPAYYWSTTLQLRLG